MLGVSPALIPRAARVPTLPLHRKVAKQQQTLDEKEKEQSEGEEIENC